MQLVLFALRHSDKSFSKSSCLRRCPMFDWGTARELHAPNGGRLNFAIVSGFDTAQLNKSEVPLAGFTYCTVRKGTALYCTVVHSVVLLSSDTAPDAAQLEPETIATTLSAPCSATMVAAPHTRQLFKLKMYI